MFVIDATDTLEGIASVANVIEFTCSVVDGTTTGSSEGKLGTSQTQIWNATAVTRILSLTLTNTHSAAVTVNVQKNAGALYRVIPKDFDLGVGYLLIFDGQRITVINALGQLLKGYAYHAASHTNGTDDIQSATNAQIGLATAAHITAIEANTAKNTNVPTSLAIGTKTGTTVAITSDGGADDVVLPAATTTEAGLMTEAQFDKLDSITVGSVAHHAATHTNGTDNIQTATTLRNGLATTAHIWAIEASISDIVEDATPQLGGELDAQAHTIGFTQQTTTGDGTTTIDWKLGNKFEFTWGAQADTFTFTAPSKPCNLLLKMIQDGTGGRDATWPATVKWLGTEPTWTDGGGGKVILAAFYYDGTNYWAQGSAWEA